MALTAIFIASLLGSLHCAAMCGGFSIYCSGCSKTPLLSQLAYNSGRWVAYVSLGVLAGVGGAYLDLAGDFVGLQKTTALIAGILLITWGLVAFFAPQKLKPTVATGRIERVASKIFGKGLSAGRGQGSSSHSFLVGLLAITLPCGWLYMFVGLAAASANPLHGALIMSAFWLGTVPVLLAFGGISQTLVRLFGRRLPRISAAFVVLAGVFSLTGHVWPSLTGMHAGHHHHMNHSMSDSDKTHVHKH